MRNRETALKRFIVSEVRAHGIDMNKKAIVEKWVPYSQRYLFNAIPDTNHNTNPNSYSKDKKFKTQACNRSERRVVFMPLISYIAKMTQLTLD